MIFLSLFITFFEIGLFGFGGGYGMLSLIQHETVETHHWLSTSEFTDIVAISQMTPGPIGSDSQCRLWPHDVNTWFCHSYFRLSTSFTHLNDTHQQDVYEVYEYPLGTIRV